MASCCSTKSDKTRELFSLLWVFFCAHKIRETVTDVLGVEGRDLSVEKIGLTWRSVIRCGRVLKW